MKSTISRSTQARLDRAELGHRGGNLPDLVLGRIDQIAAPCFSPSSSIRMAQRCAPSSRLMVSAVGMRFIGRA
jgi:hypothetical protein